MTVAYATKRGIPKSKPIPRALRARVEGLLLEEYAYMDSPIFRQRGLEKTLFDFDKEPELPLVGWYQPTREEVAEGLTGAPQLMKGPEERLMFLRFNFSKRKLTLLKKKTKR